MPPRRYQHMIQPWICWQPYHVEPGGNSRCFGMQSTTQLQHNSMLCLAFCTLTFSQCNSKGHLHKLASAPTSRGQEETSATMAHWMAPPLLLQVLTIQRHWQSELGPQRADRAVFMLQAMTTKTAQLPGDFIQFCRSIMCSRAVYINLTQTTKRYGLMPVPSCLHAVHSCWLSSVPSPSMHAVVTYDDLCGQNASGSSATN